MGGIPLISFMSVKGKSTYGINLPVINSYDVDLQSESYKYL